MLRIGSLVWGVRDLPRALAFWTAALDYRPRDEPAGDWATADWATTDWATTDWAVLVPRTGPGPQLALKLVTSAHARRHHLDLYADDQAAEVARLLALGATRPAWTYEPGADYVVLADPDGNRFCVVQKGDLA